MALPIPTFPLESLRPMSLKLLNELFDVAVSLPSDAERQAWIRQQCEGNEPLKQQLESLLASHQKGNALLEAPTQAFDLVANKLATSEEAEGTTVGNYKLLQRLGEGGMGEVFMAEQLRPIRRKVAIKIIRQGMHSKQIIARFEAEREALARLDHPNVTRILDAGMTESNRPYFAMELVRGSHITHYCNSHRVSIEQRLALLEQVCMVIHHAHQKGILHRDIKPSNVMITLHDGVPVPKVIDFGIAKALDRPLTEQTLFTRYGDLVGTPEYMSPEQAEMSGLDLDVRTDIFSLGVLLYELLTGSTPLTQAQIQGKGLLKIFETIRDSEAETPSMRVTKTVAVADTIADQRQSTATQLRRSISGELDWITMKAISKDRNERYESAAAMAKDLRRFLNGEPVEAAAPTFAYRARKFYQKHRTISIVASVCTLALLLSTAISVYWAITSQRSQQLANARAGELVSKSQALEEAKERAELALARAVVAEKKAEALARDQRMRSVLTQSQAVLQGEQVKDQVKRIMIASQSLRDSSEQPASQDGMPSVSLASPDTSVEMQAVKGANPIAVDFLPMLESLSQVSVRYLADEVTVVEGIDNDPSEPFPDTTFAINQQRTVNGPLVNGPLMNGVAVSGPTGNGGLITGPMVFGPVMIASDGVAGPAPATRASNIQLHYPPRFYEILIAQLRKEFGNTDPFVAKALLAHVDSLLQDQSLSNEKLVLAENNLRESMAIFDTSSDHRVESLTALMLFRVILHRQEKWIQAEEAKRKALTLLEEIRRTETSSQRHDQIEWLATQLEKSPADYVGPMGIQSFFKPANTISLPVPAAKVSTSLRIEKTLPKQP